MARLKLDDRLVVRCNKGVRKKFIARCDKLDRPYLDVFRELMKAFGEGRVTIKPEKTQGQAMKETYDD